MTTTAPDRRGSQPGPGAATAPTPPQRDRRVAGRLGRFGLPVLGLVVTLTAWQAAVWLFDVKPLFVPSPWAVATDLREGLPHLLEEAWVSVFETLAGFAIGGTAGLVLAVALVASSAVERAALPQIIALNAIPVVAIAPILVLWFGIGHTPHIVLAAMICFFPIMIAAMSGLRSTPADLGELARSLSASRWQAFYKVRVPWALPQVFVGLRLGITLSLIGTVVAQFTRPSGGLGTVVWLATQNARTTRSFSAIFLLMIISITLFYTVVAAERLLLPWARETRASRSL